MGVALQAEKPATCRTQASLAPASGSRAESAGGGGMYDTQYHARRCRRNSPGTGSVSYSLDGGRAAAAVTMRRLHRVWQDTMRDPQGDASKKGAERTHQKGSATERCAYGFFASSNWVVTMAPAGLTTPSTPSLRLVTLAFCRGVNNKIWCEGLPFCSGLNNLLEGFRSSRCTLPGVRTVSQAARQALVW